MANTACITGGTSGIGRAYAVALAQEGHDLIITGRRRDRLEELARELREAQGVSVEVFVGDLADPAVTTELADRLAKREDLTMLIHNAGFGHRDRFFGTHSAALRDMGEVHMQCAVALVRAAVPVICANAEARVRGANGTAAAATEPAAATAAEARGTEARAAAATEPAAATAAEARVRGANGTAGTTETTPPPGQALPRHPPGTAPVPYPPGVILVSSLAAFLPVPGPAMYTATKAFLVNFGEAISPELASKGVRTQVVCPGFTHTEFHDRLEWSAEARRNRGPVRWMAAETVARRSLRRFRRRGPWARPVYIPGSWNRLVRIVMRVIPRRALAAVK
ncbi:MAG: SDR family NAD(P)-dependent oxidoreductase [Alkalispirochaeta sp.]